MNEAGRGDQTAESVADLDPQEQANATALHARGIEHADCGDYARAVEWLGRAVALRPDLFRVRTNLGMALLEKGRADEALPHFQEAVRLQPDLAALHHNLGNALRTLDRHVEARAAYLDALRLDPERAVTHLHI